MQAQLNYLKKLELFKQLDTFREGDFYAIVDQKVKNHLPQWIQFSTKVFWLSHPEEQKNLEDYARAIDFFLKQGIHRKATIYAIGGGATTDFAGFVSATILRGIPWVAIPTTLLAMIDASIGGKVGLNVARGKNLIGAFHSPEVVYICGEFLTTLPKEQWISGKGEMLKYGFLSKEIHQLIMKKTPVEDIAAVCARFKSQIVEDDFREEGNRTLLNLGHTLGHAFESHLMIPHGQAVAMGMRYLFKLFDQTDILEEWKKMAVALALPEEKFALDHYPKFSRNEFLSFVEHDKKRIEAKVKLIRVREVGRCYIEEISMKELRSKIESHHEFSDS